MATKVVHLPDIGQVTLIKRVQSRNLRLTVKPSGVMVSLPRWTPFATGIQFALKHSSWIRSEQEKSQTTTLRQYQRIGKLHTLRFEQVSPDQKATSRVGATEVIVRFYTNEHINDQAVQERAVAACLRALRREAERLLPPRLESHAQKHNLGYSSVRIKSLKRRWGSCDSHQAITLNLYLMELPWEYIDYVLLHELTHTKHMDHGPDFWQMLSTICPYAKDLSKQLRKHQPTFGSLQS